MNICSHQKLNQRGVILPVALILLIPLTFIALYTAKRNSLEEIIAASQRDGQQALMNAESGLMLAQKQLYDIADGTSAYTLDDMLADSSNMGLVDYSLSRGEGDATVSRGVVDVTVYDNEDAGLVPYPTNHAFDCDTLIDAGYEEDCVWETDADNRVVVRSTGTFQRGERIVEALFKVDDGSPDDEPPPNETDPFSITIFTADDLEISGNPIIWGPLASVHTNADLKVSGNPEIWGDISASGSTDISGTITNQDGEVVSVEAGAPAMTVPYVFPPAYKPVATIYMTADCDIHSGWPTSAENLIAEDVKTNPDWMGSWNCDYNKEWILNGDIHSGWPTSAENLIAEDVKENPDWMGSWNCDYNKEWVLNGDTPPEGFYYVEGNATVSANPGENTDAVRMSIVAEGNVEISGNPNLIPYYVDAIDTLDPQILELLDGRENVLLTNEVLFVAGNDLKLNGNPEQRFNGLMAAHMEFLVSGAPSVEGGLIAENGRAQEAQGYGHGQEITDGREVVELSEFNTIGGDIDITGSSDIPRGDPPDDDPGGSEAGIIAATMEGWREVVD